MMIQFDCQLKPSRLRLLVLVSVLFGIAFIVALLPLTIIYKSILWILLVVCAWFSQITSYHLIAMSTLIPKYVDHSNQDGLEFLEWQVQIAQGYILIPWGEQQAVWQAQLTRIYDMGNVIVMNFAVFEPIQRTISTQIWRDQVDNETWRQIKILAR